MSKFAIRWGLGGGFGGLRMNPEILEFDTKEDAEEFALDQAIQEYESYGGMHGLTTMDEVMEEYGIEDEDEGYQAYIEAIESWLCCDVKEVNE